MMGVIYRQQITPNQQLDKIAITNRHYVFQASFTETLCLLDCDGAWLS
jgi:hypothetical protein